eukprot:1141273-Pelagomonas_calceolata.AAC.6
MAIQACGVWLVPAITGDLQHSKRYICTHRATGSLILVHLCHLTFVIAEVQYVGSIRAEIERACALEASADKEAIVDSKSELCKW